RPQSGYYVRARTFPKLAEPAPTSPSLKPGKGGVTELCMQMMRVTARKDIVQLGAALPHPALLPTLQLNRAMAAIGRRYGRALACYDSPPGNESLRIQIALR